MKNINLTVITWFKNLTPTFFTFRNFYKTVWGVDEFLYIVGYQTDEDYVSICQKYINSCGPKVAEPLRVGSMFTNRHYLSNRELIVCEDASGTKTTFLLYKTNLGSKNPLGEWVKIKQYFHGYIQKHLLSLGTDRYYVGVDDDEFYALLI